MMSAAALIRTRIDQEILDHRTLVGCLSDYRKPRDKIGRLLREGVIVRIKKGLYVFGPAFRRGPCPLETLANLIYGPSCVSLQYALAYHGLIPERVGTITSVTTGKRRTFITPLGTFTYVPLDAARYCRGIERVEGPGRSAFLIATVEKALLDLAWVDRRFHGRSIADCRAYLLEDLRIDPEGLRRLDVGRLRAIAEGHASAKITRVVKAIAALKELDHE